jgi:hypothetical protein
MANPELIELTGSISIQQIAASIGLTGPKGNTGAAGANGTNGNRPVTVTIAPLGVPGVDYSTTGTADNVIIQQAIGSLPVSGGQVILRSGTYTLAAPLVIPSGITISGEGRGTTIMTLSTNANCDMFTNSDTIGGTNTDIHIRDMTINGNKANQSNGNPGGGLTSFGGKGIYMIGVARCSAERIDAHDTYNRAVYFYNCTDGLIEKCSGRSCGSFQEQTFTLELCTRCIYSNSWAQGGTDRDFEIAFCTDCELHNCISNSSGGAGLALYATGAPFNTGILINGFIAISPTDEGIYMEGLQNSIISNVYVYNPGTAGLKNFGTGANMQDNTFSNITVYNPVQNGIITDTLRAVVDNVRVYNAGSDAIRLTSAADESRVTNCYVNGASRNCYLIQGDHSSVIGSLGKNGGQGAVSGQTYGLRLESTHCQIIGNCFFDDQGSPTQTHGIREVAPGDFNTIIGNDVTGLSFTVVTNGANTLVGINQGSTGNLVIPGITGTADSSIAGKLSLTKTASFNSEVDNGNSSTAITINWTNGNKQKVTLTGNCTFTFTNPAGPATLTFKLIQDGTGSRTVSWPSVKWAGGTPITLTTTASATDLVSLYFDGTSYYAMGALNFS